MNRLALLLIVIAALAAACGGGASPSSPSRASSAAPLASGAVAPPADPGSSPGAVGATVQACDLLTETDIKELTGLAVAKTKPGKTQGVWDNGCEWSLTG